MCEGCEVGKPCWTHCRRSHAYHAYNLGAFLCRSSHGPGLILGYYRHKERGPAESGVLELTGLMYGPEDPVGAHPVPTPPGVLEINISGSLHRVTNLEVGPDENKESSRL